MTKSTNNRSHKNALSPVGELTTLDLLSDDDFLGLSEAAAKQYLAEAGVTPVLADQIPDVESLLSRSIIGNTDEYNSNEVETEPTWQFDDEETLDYIAPRTVEPAIWEALDSCHAGEKRSAVMVIGARGSGKSTLWRARLKQSPEFRERFDVSVTIDCFSLRSRSLLEVELDALFSLTENDCLFQRILTEARRETAADIQREFGGDKLREVNSDIRPLLTYLKLKFGLLDKDQPLSNGLLVLDHVDCLSGAPEIFWWLDTLVERMSATGVKVLLLASSGRNEKLDRCLKKCVRLELAPLEDSEISSLWARDQFTQYQRSGISEDAVSSVVGGSPRLLRDFCRFLESEKGTNHTHIVDAFIENEIHAYNPEIERFFEKVFRDSDAAPSTRPGGCTKWLTHVSPQSKLGKSLLSTGAVHSKDAQLTFVSSIFEMVFEDLNTHVGLGRLYTLDKDEVFARRLNERTVLSDRMTTSLIGEEVPYKVWGRVSRIYNELGLEDSSIWIRDAANAKLWSCVYDANLKHSAGGHRTTFCGDGGHRYWYPTPLYKDEDPDVALAVQSGRIVSRGVHKTILPFQGETGRVSTLLIGQHSTKGLSPYSLRSELRLFWHLALKLQPALALACERALNRRAERLRRSVSYRSERTIKSKSSDIFSSFLSQAGCSAVVVMERGPFGWSVVDGSGINGVDAAKQSGLSLVWRQTFEPSLDRGRALSRELDEIFDHPSGRGVVRAGSDLKGIFPRLNPYEEVAAFLCPQAEDGRQRRRLIVFASVNSVASANADTRKSEPVAISGEEQQAWRNLAPLVNAACGS